MIMQTLQTELQRNRNQAEEKKKSGITKGCQDVLSRNQYSILRWEDVVGLF
jgi:hypothetical protein